MKANKVKITLHQELSFANNCKLMFLQVIKMQPAIISGRQQHCTWWCHEILTTLALSPKEKWKTLGTMLWCSAKCIFVSTCDIYSSQLVPVVVCTLHRAKAWWPYAGHRELVHDCPPNSMQCSWNWTWLIFLLCFLSSKWRNKRTTLQLRDVTLIA